MTVSALKSYFNAYLQNTIRTPFTNHEISGTEKGCFFPQNQHFEFFFPFFDCLCSFCFSSQPILFSLKQYKKKVTDLPQLSSCTNWICGVMDFGKGGCQSSLAAWLMVPPPHSPGLVLALFAEPDGIVTHH